MYEIDENEYVLHPENQTEAGFSLATFHSRDTFRKLLKQQGLELEEVGDGEHTQFVWHGEDVLIVTGANPLTEEPPCAGSIGINGKVDDVVDVYKFIRENADWEQKCSYHRGFI